MPNPYYPYIPESYPTYPMPYHQYLPPARMSYLPPARMSNSFQTLPQFNMPPLCPTPTMPSFPPTVPSVPQYHPSSMSIPTTQSPNLIASTTKDSSVAELIRGRDRPEREWRGSCNHGAHHSNTKIEEEVNLGSRKVSSTAKCEGPKKEELLPSFVTKIRDEVLKGVSCLIFFFPRLCGESYSLMVGICYSSAMNSWKERCVSKLDQRNCQLTSTQLYYQANDKLWNVSWRNVCH